MALHVVTSKPPEEVSVDKIVSEEGYPCSDGFGAVDGVGIYCRRFTFDGVDWDAVGKGSKSCIGVKGWVDRLVVNGPAFCGSEEIP